MLEDVKKATEELAIIYERVYTRGIQTGNGGNVSARVSGKDLMIVRASGSSFVDSTPDGFVITDFGRNLVEGERGLTGEASLHSLLYRAYPKVNVVVHTHSPHSIVWTSTGRALKRTTRHTQLKMSADLPSLDVPAAMAKKEYPSMVEDIYRENSDLPGFLLVDHGLVVVGKDAINTKHTAELIEETVQVVVLEVTTSKLGL